MKHPKSLDLLCFIFVALSLAACGGASVVAVSPSATPVPATDTPLSPTVAPTLVPPTDTSVPPIATLTPEILIDLRMEIPEGDPKRGRNAALRYGCYGCHANPKYPSSGPRFESSAGLPGIFERGDLRIADPAYEGKAATNREYVIESIFLPEVYVVSGDWKEAMPTHIRDRITEEDLANIMAWLSTFE